MESTPASRRFAPCASGQHQECAVAHFSSQRDE
jgi:hypothetical protein